MRLPNTSTTKKGSMLVELSIAVAIISISIMAIATLLFTRESYSINAHLRRRALFSAVSRLENARSQLEKKYVLSIESSSTEDGITNIISALDETPCLKNITSQSSWSSFGLEKKITFSLQIPFLEYAQNIDGDCEGTIIPKDIASTTSPTISMFNGVSSSTLIDVIDNQFIIGTHTGSTSSIALFKKDQTNSGSTIELLGSITIAGEIFALDASQKYIYLGLLGTTSPFQVIDIHDPTHPTLISKNTLPGVAGSFPGATSIFYYNKKVYIGTHRTAGNEFHVFDVSNQNPVWLGSIELNHNINSISIREPYAFLATSGNTQDVMILDISNPKAIKKVSNLAFVGTEDALSEFLIGNNLYIGRKKSLKPLDADFIIVDVEDPQFPKIRSSMALQKSVYHIRVAGHYAFLTTENSLEILDILDPLHSSLAKDIPIQSTIKDFDFEDSHGYILLDSQVVDMYFK